MNTGRTRRSAARVLSGFAALLLAAACDSRAPELPSAPDVSGALRGTVTYRERMALARGSTVEIRLEDVTVADAPAVLLGEQTIAVEEQQVPLAFAVPYAPDAIDARRTYALRATIRAPDGALLFATAEQHRAFDGAGQPIQPLEIVAHRASSSAGRSEASASTGITGGAWRLTAMSPAGTAERPVAAEPAYTIEFGSDGRYNGRADCNRYAGSYQRPAPERLALAPGPATLAACPPGSMADDFMRAVATAASFLVTGETLRLELRGGGYLLFVRESEPPAVAAAPEVGRTFVFDCDGDLNFTIRTGPGEVALWMPAALGGGYHVLSLAMSASGARYVEGDIEVWNKGDLATFDIAGRRFVDCRSNPAKVPWADAARRGVLFRALGNEPSWYVEVLNDRFAVVTELGAHRVELPYGAAIVDGAITTYRGSGSLVTVEVERRACNDTMSGEAFEASATVTLEDRVLTGCGRFL